MSASSRSNSQHQFKPLSKIQLCCPAISQYVWVIAPTPFYTRTMVRLLSGRLTPDTSQGPCAHSPLRKPRHGGCGESYWAPPSGQRLPLSHPSLPSQPGLAPALGCSDFLVSRRFMNHKPTTLTTSLTTIKRQTPYCIKAGSNNSPVFSTKVKKYPTYTKR